MSAVEGLDRACDGIEAVPLIPGAGSEFGAASGERRLWLAVLVSAVLDLSRVGEGPKTRRYRAEAQEWFESETEDVGTFRWVCVHLDLEPEPFRRRVLAQPTLRARQCPMHVA